MNCQVIFNKVSKAAQKLAIMDDSEINAVLRSLAQDTVKSIPFLVSENEKDLKTLEKSDPMYDRLLLTPERIKDIASDIMNVMSMANPVGRIISESVRPNGLKISRISVPFGVIGIIFESRPNVTFDVFSLCLKSRNACILKGGSEAANSNIAIVRIIRSILEKHDFDQDIIALLPTGREETEQLLNAQKYVDLIIPRGSKSLIEFVRKNSTIPIIETGAGVCHTYFDEFGDREKGRNIVNNAKTRKVSVCNALDCLIIHEKRLKDLAYITESCSHSKVIIYADEKALPYLKDRYPDELLLPVDKNSYGTEFLSYKMAIKTVCSFQEALDHIALFGSKHSEAIISEDRERIKLFLSLVDASSVYSNASTAFTDGAQFGLGAEIGISTQKLHARGPMALEELTSYKWIIEGDGHVRN